MIHLNKHKVWKDKNMNNNLGKRIKEARKIRKITQAQLAKTLNISQQTLRSYETDSNSKLNILKELSNSLDVPLNLLVNGVDERFKDVYSFEDLVKDPEMYYQEYLPRLRSEYEAEEIEETETKIDIFNEMMNFIEELALNHKEEKFNLIFETVSLFIKEEILKNRDNDNKNNVFLDSIDNKLSTKYDIKFHGKALGLSDEEKEKLKSILPELKKMFDI